MNARFVEAKGGQFTLSIYCFFEDFSLSVFNSQGQRHFIREEALAYITSVEMVDFPLLHLQEEFEDEFGSSSQDNVLTMFYKRIRMQLIQLKELATDLYQRAVNFVNASPNMLADSKSADISVDEITRDEFNLNQLIVAVTSVGKVFGLYTSANGRILWSFYLKNSAPFKLSKASGKLDLMPMFLQRTAAHVPYEAQCVLLAKTLVDGVQKTRVYFFNPLTGQPSKDFSKEGVIVDYEVKQAFLLNIHDSHHLKPLALFDSENRMHVLPEKSAKEVLAKSSKATVIYSSNVDANGGGSSLVGYAMKTLGKPLPEVWRLNLEDEQIVSIAAKLPNDRIHSQGKVLGDRSVLYKYLNPNMIGVVTTGQDSQKVPFINVYLVDTVTGSVINSFNHKRCRGPVNIVHSENWFFVSCPPPFFSPQIKTPHLFSLNCNICKVLVLQREIQTPRSDQPRVVRGQRTVELDPFQLDGRREASCVQQVVHHPEVVRLHADHPNGEGHLDKGRDCGVSIRSVDRDPVGADRLEASR